MYKTEHRVGSDLTLDFKNSPVRRLRTRSRIHQTEMIRYKFNFFKFQIDTRRENAGRHAHAHTQHAFIEIRIRRLYSIFSLLNEDPLLRCVS